MKAGTTRIYTGGKYTEFDHFVSKMNLTWSTVERTQGHLPGNIEGFHWFITDYCYVLAGNTDEQTAIKIFCESWIYFLSEVGIKIIMEGDFDEKIKNMSLVDLNIYYLKTKNMASWLDYYNLAKIKDYKSLFNVLESEIQLKTFISIPDPPQPIQIKEKTIKPFSEHLKHAKPIELANICQAIFNKNNSPKDYAIMLCLLSEKKFVTVPNKTRKPFYESWYRFINMKLPKDSNFTAINKHIDDKAYNGFAFRDETDQDYRFLKDALDKTLKDNKL